MRAARVLFPPVPRRFITCCSRDTFVLPLAARDIKGLWQRARSDTGGADGVKTKQSDRDVVLSCGATAAVSLHSLHVTQITVKNPHAQSFQLLNNTKQTLTHFRSREQARSKTRSGARLGGGAEAGLRRRAPRIGSPRDVRHRRAWPDM